MNSKTVFVFTVLLAAYFYVVARGKVESSIHPNGTKVTILVHVQKHFLRKHDAFYTRRVLFQAHGRRHTINMYRRDVKFPHVSLYSGVFSEMKLPEEINFLFDLYFGEKTRHLKNIKAWFGQNSLELEADDVSGKEKLRVVCQDMPGVMFLDPGRVEGPCAFHLTHKRVNKNLPRFGYVHPPCLESSNCADSSLPEQMFLYSQDRSHLESIFHKDTVTGTNDLPSAFLVSPSQNKSRKKRNDEKYTGKSCSLHLVADHMFYHNYCHGDLHLTVRNLLTVVMEADYVFRATDFNGDLIVDKIGLFVENITVMEKPLPQSLWKSSPVSANDYLLLVASTFQFDHVCLGIAFTYRVFLKDTVGLAYLARSNTASSQISGGICRKRVYSTVHRKNLNINTLVVTALDQAVRTSIQTIASTLAHELGHSFGATHDDLNDPLCSPEDKFGKYLMHPLTTTGVEEHNYRFSPCSLASIYPVIMHKGDCLKPDEPSRCGDFIVDPGEDCDCGIASTCGSLDPCCQPSDGPGGCKLKPGAVCSPAVSDCCMANCQVVPKKMGHACGMPSDCHEKIYCDGSGPECPMPETRPYGTLCDSGRRVCKDGHCSIDACAYYGLERCTCPNPSDACLLCCKQANKPGSSCSLGAVFGIKEVSGNAVVLERGFACGNGMNFCIHGNCVELAKQPAYASLEVDYQQLENKAVWFFLVVPMVFVAALTFALWPQVRSCWKGKVGAQFLQLTGVAREHRQKLKSAQTALSEKINSAIVHLKSTPVKEETFDEGEMCGRLGVLFPSVPLLLLESIVLEHTNEDDTVRFLISLNHLLQFLHD